MSDQDQDWLELLAGREAKAAEPQTRQEAEALRSMILRHHQNELENNQINQDEVAQARGLNQLLERLAQEGLLEEPRLLAKTKSKRLRTYSSLAVALVIFIGVFILMPLSQEPLLPQISTGFKEPPRLRSDMQTQTIPVKNQRESLQTARQLVQELTELNIPFRLTPLEGDDRPDWQLEITIPFEPSDTILTFLKEWRLKQTENGWIRIVPETSGPGDKLKKGLSK